MIREKRDGGAPPAENAAGGPPAKAGAISLLWRAENALSVALL